MSKPGNYTAYQQYKPLDNGTIQAIQHWSNFYEQKRQNDIAQAQKDKEFKNKIDEQKQKEQEDWLKYEGVPATGVKNVDIHYQQVLDKNYDLIRQNVDKLNKMDRSNPEWTPTVSLIKKLQYTPTALKNTTTPVLERAKQYYKDLADDKIVKDPKAEAMFQNLDNAETIINPKTGEIGIAIKDPKDPTKTKVLTEREIMEGTGLVELTPKLDWQDTIIETATRLNKTPNVKKVFDPKTNLETEITGYNNEDIKAIAQSQFMDTKGKLTPIAKSFLMQKGLYDAVDNQDENSYNELLKLQDQFVNDITPLIQDKYKEEWQGERANFEINKEYKRNQTAQNWRKLDLAQEKLNLDKDKAAGKGEVTKTFDELKFKPFSKEQNAQFPKYQGFNVVENNLKIVAGPKGKQIEKTVEAIYINPKDKTDIMIRGDIREPGQKGKVKQTGFSLESKNPNDIQEFQSIIGQIKTTDRALYNRLYKEAGLKNKVKPNTKAKPKATDYGL